MEEELISWLFLFITFVVIFCLLRKRRPATSAWLRIVAIGLCFTANAVFCITLYLLVMSTGMINSGYLDFNELLVFSASWTLVAMVSLALARLVKHRLQGIYNTVLITQAILAVIPSIFIFILLV